MNEKLDVLNRDGFIIKIKTLIEIMSESKQGCCFALNGAWGSGKSFVLEKLEDKLKEQLIEETEDNKYYVFHYDCWKYDYYEEPTVAIIAAMLDETNKELALFSEETETAMKISLTTARELLGAVASELCKNKIGIDLVEIASKVTEKQGESSIDDFDSLYGFKRALEKARRNIQEIAKDKTVVVVVDELDRCIPEYAIRVLERLHHIFEDLDNVIVLVSMDKEQLEHSIINIYGAINVDTYLRKFISFKVDLDKGKASSYAEKFSSYFSNFDVSTDESKEIEKFFSDIFVGMDMRTLERIFNKAEVIHNIIKEDVRDCSIMTFEILYLTIAFKTKSKHLEWLSKIWSSNFVNHKQLLGEQYYNMLSEYAELVRGRTQYGGAWGINDTLMGKTFFWLANMYGKYNNGECMPYFYKYGADKRVALVHRFASLIDIIDCD